MLFKEDSLRAPANPLVISDLLLVRNTSHQHLLSLWLYNNNNTPVVSICWHTSALTVAHCITLAFCEAALRVSLDSLIPPFIWEVFLSNKCFSFVLEETTVESFCSHCPWKGCCRVRPDFSLYCTLNVGSELPGPVQSRNTCGPRMLKFWTPSSFPKALNSLVF